MIRHDYAFPLRIDAGSGEVARAGYADHVQQLIRQLLLTSPGERVCLPEFGCGLRRMVFAPQSEALAATAQIHVRQALTTWLPDHVALTDVTVLAGAGADPADGLDVGEVLVTVRYVLVDTQTAASLTVRVS
jgi:phage baseplate assembly protein W